MEVECKSIDDIISMVVNELLDEKAVNPNKVEDIDIILGSDHELEAL